VVEYELPDLTIPAEDQTYMVLESVTSNTSKVIHVVNLQEMVQIRVGRGQDCDVRVTDISVSRLHSIIKRSQEGFFYLDDNHSKFGTLALIQAPIELPPGQVSIVQAGRSMLQIEHKLAPQSVLQSCTPCCISSKKKPMSNKKGLAGMVTRNGIDYFPVEFSEGIFGKKKEK
jgi:hypothetical protein